MISVVIPLYNKESQIRNTLNSVLAQTFTDYEIIIVNDGSTDHSVEQVQKIQDSRIRLIHQNNSGVSVARNTGIAEAKGEFVAFLDADDEWKSDYLQTQFLLSQKYPLCDVFAVNYEFREANGNVRPIEVNKLPFSSVDGVLSNYFEVASCSHPPICSISVMVRTNCMRKLGGFPLGITHGEDLLTWARLAATYSIAYSQKPLAIYVLNSCLGRSSKPKNIPQGNEVGDALEKLLDSKMPFNNQLKKYVGRWYKIRSSIFLRGGERKNAFINICRALHFYPTELKLYIYLLLLLLPTRWVMFLFKKV